MGIPVGFVRPVDGFSDASAVALLGEMTLQALQERFPEWRIFSRSGQWWALRGGQVGLAGPESLLRRTLKARDLPGLTEQLCVQDRLDRLDPQELAAVYREMTLPRISANACLIPEPCPAVRAARHASVRDCFQEKD
jgi:hypothetical protein